ncbi:phosphotransferase family protein [Kitasatospora sp. NPDC058478]|uniref:phosphotransferase family protein n=1 Tax=unclassified Kitasatospora TaxID=2633591 RepID=UPI0036666BA7
MNPDESRKVVSEAARAQGLDPRGAVLIQGGPTTNHTFRLPESGAIAKVFAPGTRHEEALREMRVGQWLRGEGIRAPRPVGRDPYPVQRETRRHVLQINFVQDLGTGRATAAQFGVLLRKLHSLEVPRRLALPVFDPVTTLSMRIATLPPGTLTPGEDRRARAILAEARTAWKSAALTACTGAVHGDVGLANSAVGQGGEPGLIDFERTALGPRQWDLAAFAWRRDIYGADPAEYQQFTSAYGADVTTHDDGRTYAAMTPVLALSAMLTAADFARAEPAWRHEAGLRRRTALADPLPPFPWDWRIGRDAEVPVEAAL